MPEPSFFSDASRAKLRRLYYYLKPVIPKVVRMKARRFAAKRILERSRGSWPIDPCSSNPPQQWGGWPNDKQFAFVLSHDVEGELGFEKLHQLAKLEEELGFRSSFNFIPEGKYTVSKSMRRDLERRNFEIGVHDLKHDGKLYNSRESFRESAERINQYMCDWGAVGFRSAFMLHNLEWIHDLEILYDSSTFDTDVFEPQPHGVGTIFPFWCSLNPHGTRGYVEMPYTLPQDSTLFLILRQKSARIWKEKLDWIVEHGGMAFLNVHPDYLRFNGEKRSEWEFDAELYRDFLCYVKQRYKGLYWSALPKDVAAYYRNWHRTKGAVHCEDVETESGVTQEVWVGSSSSGSMLTLGTLSALIEFFSADTARCMEMFL